MGLQSINQPTCSARSFAYRPVRFSDAQTDSQTRGEKNICFPSFDFYWSHIKQVVNQLVSSSPSCGERSKRVRKEGKKINNEIGGGCMHLYLYIYKYEREGMPITSRQHVSTLLFFFFQGFLTYIYKLRCYCQIVLFFPFSIQLLLLLPPPHMMPALPLLTRENLQVCRPFFFFPAALPPSSDRVECNTPVCTFSPPPPLLGLHLRLSSSSSMFVFLPRLLYIQNLCVCVIAALCVWCPISISSFYQAREPGSRVSSSADRNPYREERGSLSLFFLLLLPLYNGFLQAIFAERKKGSFPPRPFFSKFILNA